MKMIEVESSNINSIGWSNNELYVQFKNGRTYKYLDVSEDVFYEMIGMKSRGQYLNQSIKPFYKYEFVS